MVSLLPKKPNAADVHQHAHLAQPIKLFCFDITNWVKPVRFFVLCLAIFFFYLIYGYIQELVFRLPGMKPFGWYLTLVQFALYAVLSYTEMQCTTGIMRRIPWHIYFQIAFYTVATMGLSNASLGYLNYPTQVIFKCCKLIPVLVGGIVIQGKRYGPLDVLAAALMSLGLIIFSLADSKVSPNFDPRGYAMISLALVADAIIGNVQEKAMRAYNASNDEMVLFSYSIGFGYIFVGLFLSGQLSGAFLFFAQYPLQTYGNTVLIGIVGYFGVNVVLTMVRTSGALVAVTVTTMRKAVTIAFSFYLFAKPFTVGYLWGGLVVLLAIYLNVYTKNKKKFDAKLAEWWTNFADNGERIADERKLLLQV